MKTRKAGLEFLVCFPFWRQFASSWKSLLHGTGTAGKQSGLDPPRIAGQPWVFLKATFLTANSPVLGFCDAKSLRHNKETAFFYTVNILQILILLSKADVENPMKINFLPFHNLRSWCYYRHQKTETPLNENLCEALTARVISLSAVDSFRVPIAYSFALNCTNLPHWRHMHNRIGWSLLWIPFPPCCQPSPTPEFCSCSTSKPFLSPWAPPCSLPILTFIIELSWKGILKVL